jgi:hypothetical protein
VEILNPFGREPPVAHIVQNVSNLILTSIYLVPLLTKRCQPNIGITHRSDKPHAKPINNKARARVRLPRY